MPVMKQLIRLCICMLPLSAFGQIQTTMPFMQRLHQSSYYNPAITPSYSSSFNVPVFPGFGLDLSLQGFNARTALDHIDADGLIDLPAVHRDIKGDKIQINTDLNLELFHLRFRSKNWFYGISLNHRTTVSAAIAKDLLGFVINGNSFFGGRPADFSKTEVNALAYSELGFSMARNYKRWNVGGRAKFLAGNAATKTSNTQVSFYTPQRSTDEIVVKINGSLHTSGLAIITDSINKKPVDESEKTYDPNDFSSFRNLGGAIDLGATYDVNSRFTIGAAVSDLGFISWNQKTYNYYQKDVEVKFGGIDDYNSLGDDSVLTRLGDSLSALFDGNITREGFSTMLPMRFLFNANYDLNKRNSIGALVQGRYFNEELLMAYTANYMHKFRNVDVALNYSIIGNNYVNVGVGFAAKMGAFQFYLVQDNILSYFALDKAQVISLRFGLNIVWGEIRKPLKVY